jgi:hypothetical protein
MALNAPMKTWNSLFVAPLLVYLEKLFDLVEPKSNKNLVVIRDGNNVHIDGAGEVWCF